MTSIQWQRVGEGQWKAVGTKASMHVPIPGLASLPEDIQSQINLYIPYIPKESHPLAECITDLIRRMASNWNEEVGLYNVDWEDGMSMIGENAQHRVYKLFWVNDFKRQRKVEHRAKWYYVPWVDEYDDDAPWTYPYLDGEYIWRWVSLLMRR